MGSRNAYREAMNIAPAGTMGGPGEVVEVDETYWGNVGKQAPGARGYEHKMKIVSLVKRNGHKRSFHVASVTAATVTPILKEHIASKARVMTDELSVYKRLGTHFAEHGVVNHSKKEYVRFDITTNTVESSFAVLKRGLYGTFPQRQRAASSTLRDGVRLQVEHAPEARL